MKLQVGRIYQWWNGESWIKVRCTGVTITGLAVIEHEDKDGGRKNIAIVAETQEDDSKIRVTTIE